MRVKTESMIGHKYGRLTVENIDHWKQLKTGKRAYVKCKCECGNEVVVCAYALTSGGTKSCGCYFKETRSQTARKHGESASRLYHIFHDMHRRCNNPKRQSYARYGGRGIKVCDEWNQKTGFENFFKWAMENGYKDDLSIDRIDYNGDYEPSNCRWADAITQANNSSWNHVIECNGEPHTLAEWGRIRNINSGTLVNRLKLGWSIEEALEFVPHKVVRRDEVLYTINGETHNIREWCRIRNLSVDTVRYRREHNWSPEEIFGFKERA